MMYPDKLQIGDEIRVIAPSRSISIVKKDVYRNALDFLNKKGYRVTFSDKCREIEYADSAGIASRVSDIHDAFSDRNVKAIITAVGGFNVNQILEDIDYSIIRDNPKIICGYSDITALLNAIYAKTGLVTYHGPHFSTFGSEKSRKYTSKYFEKCVMVDEKFRIIPSSDTVHYEVIQEGYAEGTIVGGNLCTLNLLQGTEFMPQMKDIILFLEDINMSGDYYINEFDRNLQSLLQVSGSKVNGVVFGRFPKKCDFTVDQITRIVNSKSRLQNVPIVFNADFGHVYPSVTFPIGGIAIIVAKSGNVKIDIVRH